MRSDNGVSRPSLRFFAMMLARDSSASVVGSTMNPFGFGPTAPMFFSMMLETRWIGCRKSRVVKATTMAINNPIMIPSDKIMVMLRICHQLVQEQVRVILQVIHQLHYLICGH